MAEIHIAKNITGGGLSLDAIRTATIGDNDCCFVQMPDNVCYVYRYESSSTAAESSPDTIIPNDNSSGTGAWLKQSVESTGADYEIGHWRYTTGNGVDPGSASSSGTIPLNDEVEDNVTVAGTYPDGSYRVYLPSGTYRCWGYATGYHTNGFRAALYNSSDSAIILYGSSARASSSYGVTDQSVFFGFFTIAASKYIRIDYYAESTSGALLGQAAGIGSIDEVHAELIVWSVS